MSRKHVSTRRRLSLEALEARCLLAANALDPAFGSSGIVITHVGPAGATHEGEGSAVALQPDGKIVAVGRASTGYSKSTGYQYDFGVVRYNTDGSLDNTFSGDGKTTTVVVSNHGDQPTDVEVQGDGKIVVAGFASGDFAVVRYKTDGALDTSFSGDGELVTDIGKNSDDAAFAMKLQEDGKIILAGYTRPNSRTSDRDLALVRYKSDGSLDTTFSGDGKVTTHFSSPISPFSSAMDMAIYPSASPRAGKILVVSELSSAHSIVVVRYNPDGALDPSFGGGAGYVTLDYGDLGGQSSALPSCAIEADDRIVLTFEGAGSGAGLGTVDVNLARFQPDGNLDLTFGSAGTVNTPLPGDEIPGSVAIQANGQIVVAGWQDANFFAAHYDPLNGSLDTTFGVNGITVSTGVSIASVSTSDNVDIVLQPDGRIVMAGRKSGGDFALARFLGDAPTTLVMAAAIATTGRGSIQPNAAVQTQAGADPGQLPLSFDANQGQVDCRVDFLARGVVYSSFRTRTKAVLSPKQNNASNTVVMKRVRALLATRAVGLDKLSGGSDHRNGNDPLQ